MKTKMTVAGHISTAIAEIERQAISECHAIKQEMTTIIVRKNHLKQLIDQKRELLTIVIIQYYVLAMVSK